MKKIILISALALTAVWLINKNHSTIKNLPLIKNQLSTKNQLSNANEQTSCFYNFNPKSFTAQPPAGPSLSEIKSNIAAGGSLVDLATAVETAMENEDFSGLVAYKNTVTELLGIPTANKTGLYLLRAKLNLSQHQFKEAISDIQMAEASHPLEANYVKAYTHLALGNLIEARKIAENILNEFPAQKTYALMALIEAEADNIELAQKHFTKATCLDDHNEPQVSFKVRRQFADFLHSSGQQAEATKAYQFLAGLDKTNPDFTYGLAEIAASENSTSKALEFINQSLEQSEDAKYLIFKAAQLQKTGGANAAMELLKKAETTVRAEIASGGFGHSAELAEILVLQGLPETVAEAKVLIENELKKRSNKNLRALHKKLNQL